MSQTIKVGTKVVRPLLSVDREESRRRVLTLYKAWSRQMPSIVRLFDITKSVEQCRVKLREEFNKNKDVTDIRVCDMLVIKGQMDLKECVENWKQHGHVMNYFKETVEPRPSDFLSKFLVSNHE